MSAERFTLQDLADRAEIADLLARYSRAVDRRDFAALPALYAPGAVQDHGEAFCGEAPLFIEWLRQTMGTMKTQHLVANMLIAIDGTEAQGEIYTINTHIFPGEPAMQMTAGGRYLDHYVKREGRWLFARRRRVIDWSREEPARPSPYTVRSAQGTCGPDDPSFEELPLLAG